MTGKRPRPIFPNGDYATKGRLGMIMLSLQYKLTKNTAHFDESGLQFYLQKAPITLQRLMLIRCFSPDVKTYKWYLW